MWHPQLSSVISKAVLLGLILTRVPFAQETQLTTRQVPVFTVVGLQTRTTTARELNGHGSIANLWKQMLQGQLLNQIPNRANNDLIAVYTEFENGKDGSYTYVLGVKVNVVGKLPPGMRSQQAGGGSYAVLTSEGQLLGEMILDSWKQIWSREKAHTIAHAYTNDFEIHYNGPPDDPKHVAMDLFVSIRPLP